MPSLKIVLDTNVLVAAFVFKGQCGKIFDWCVENSDNYVSDWILEETERILLQKLKVPKTDVGAIKSVLSNELAFTRVAPSTPLPDVCRDKDDNNVLQLAETVVADYIVTGDKDLLVLKEFQGVKIVNPTEFLLIIGS